jgi:hypothetical protein
MLQAGEPVASGFDQRQVQPAGELVKSKANSVGAWLKWRWRSSGHVGERLTQPFGE